MGSVVHNAPRLGRKARRRRQGAAGNAAALAAIAVAIPATLGMLGHTTGPAAGHRPAGLAGAPEFFAGVAERPPGQIPPATVVNIYRSATGRVAASIRPPAPYHDFVAVSRLGGDHTFVAAAITGFSHFHPICTAHLFRFGVDRHGRPSGLTPLSVPHITTGLVMELVSSADGKTLAFTASGCAAGPEIGLINLATGQTTTWKVPHRRPIPVSFGSLSLTQDGSKLGFVDGRASGQGITSMYILPTDSPSGPLLRHARKVLRVPTGVLRVVLGNDGTQAYVETMSVPAGGPAVLYQYSTTTGRRVRLVGRLSPGDRWRGAYSLTVDAAGKHLLANGGDPRLTVLNLITGHRATITVAQVPFLDTPYDTAAW